MKTIIDSLEFEILQKENYDSCRNLCNELMQYQKSQAIIDKEKFDSMNYDTRMKPSLKIALENNVILVKDKNTPIAYIYSTINYTSEMKKFQFPLLPEWENLPEKVGHLNNLYVQKKYQNMSLGKKLFDLSMEWLESFDEINLILVHVSNGNQKAYDFYIKNGFKFSHDILGGFIKCLFKFK